MYSFTCIYVLVKEWEIITHIHTYTHNIHIHTHINTCNRKRQAPLQQNPDHHVYSVDDNTLSIICILHLY